MFDLSLFSKLLSERIGLDADSIGEKSIERALISAMRNSNMENMQEYYDLLKYDLIAFQNLIEEIVVPETWFFRDREPFNYLKSFVNNLKANPEITLPIRILSAPCSTGEEPYSIAMAMLEAGFAPAQFKIEAIDISEQAINFAKNAIYGKNSFRNDTSDSLKKYFSEHNGSFSLNEKIKECVHFQNANLTNPAFFMNSRPFHVIFCKNLLIYLCDDARKLVLSNISRLLEDSGLLFTGHSETLFFLQYGFDTVNHPRAFCCTKKKIGSQVEKISPRINQIRNRGIYYTTQNGNNSTKIENQISTIKTIDNKQESELLSEIEYLANTGALDEAQKLTALMMEKFPNNQEGYYFAGLISEAGGKENLAENFYNKALYLNPNHYKSLVNLSLIYSSKGNKPQADLLMDRANRSVL